MHACKRRSSSKVYALSINCINFKYTIFVEHLYYINVQHFLVYLICKESYMYNIFFCKILNFNYIYC